MDSHLQTPLPARIQRYLRAEAPAGRAHTRIGPFLATFHLRDANPYLNYAIPDDAATPSTDDVAALMSAYRSRDRRPRLEYVPDVAPQVEGALLAGGFRAEGRLALMAWRPDPTHRTGPPEGVELVRPVTDADLWDMAVVQAEAYGDEAPDPGIVGDQRASIDRGVLAVIARNRQSGSVVGAGICSPIRDGLSEVASIAVVPSERGRGIATAVSSRLAQDAIASGADLPWLMAANDTERSAYRRAGFVVVGQILHISAPG